MLRIHVTGVGDAFTERYHNASLCIEEPASGFRLQIDCPPAYPRVLADYRQKSEQKSGAPLAVGTIDHLLLTHLHGDHCGGTEAYLALRRFVTRRKPTLHGAKEVLDALWPSRLAGGMKQLLLSVPEWNEAALAQRKKASAERAMAELADDALRLADPGGPLRQLELADYTERQDLQAGVSAIGPLRVERRFTRHHIPTTALRISLDGARRPLIGYSADTAFDPDLIDWLAESELVIHETNLGVHTPLHSLLLLPDAVKARMRLIHYPDLLDVASCPISCLREGEAIDIG